MIVTIVTVIDFRLIVTIVTVIHFRLIVTIVTVIHFRLIVTIVTVIHFRLAFTIVIVIDFCLIVTSEDAGVGTESTRKRPNKEFLILILSSGALFVALIIGAGFLWR